MIDGRTLWDWMLVPLFTIGGTSIDAAKMAAVVVLVCGAWWVAARIEVGIRAFGARHSTSLGSVYAWARIVRYAFWVLATLAGLDLLGISLSSFAIVGGAVGVGIGFGLQNIFSNFFSGIILLLEKTLKEGDFVDLQSGTRGHVTEIGLRYTRITTNDAVDVIVPNSEFISGRVVNWTLGNSDRRLHVPFGVAYGSDKEAVREAALRAAAAVQEPRDDASRRPEVWLVNFGESSLDFELVVWVDGDATMTPARTDAAYRWALHDALVAAGIEIPFAQRDLRWRDGEVRVRIARDDATPDTDAATPT